MTMERIISSRLPALHRSLLAARTLRATFARLHGRAASPRLRERVASARQAGVRGGRYARLPADWLASRVNTASPRAAILLRFANTVQDFRQSEIDLPALHVHLDDLHGHAIAEPEHAPGVLTLQNVRTLDEPVVVVRHGGHVDEPLDEMLDELDEQPKRGDARDVSVELIAHFVRHEADLLPLHELPLRIVCAPLALRGVPRDLGQVIGELVLSILSHQSMPRLAQRAVHDQVR